MAGSSDGKGSGRSQQRLADESRRYPQPPAGSTEVWGSVGGERSIFERCFVEGRTGPEVPDPTMVKPRAGERVSGYGGGVRKRRSILEGQVFFSECPSLR